jgi:hypothetical protein
MWFLRFFIGPAKLKCPVFGFGFCLFYGFTHNAAATAECLFEEISLSLGIS